MKRSLAALALAGLVAAPAAAQDAHVWTDMRPDAVEPVGIRTARTLDAGSFFADYTLANERYEGLQLGSEEASLDFILGFYSQVPFEREDTRHLFTFGYGLTDRLTLVATGSYLDVSRAQTNDDGDLGFFDYAGIGDAMIDLLVDVYESDAIRGHASLGLDIPTGSIDEGGLDVTESVPVLPYDDQLGSGSIALRPAITGRVQNAKATVGSQVEGRFFLNENDRGYRLGNAVSAKLWAAYMFTSAVAVNFGVDYSRFAEIEGADPVLDPLTDPGQDPRFADGTRVDIPVGLTLMLPEDTPFGGTILSAEWLFPVHQEYVRTRLRAESGFRISLSRVF